jgi:alpha-1,2-mannosyltransferase
MFKGKIQKEEMNANGSNIKFNTMNPAWILFFAAVVALLSSVVLLPFGDKTIKSTEAFIIPAQANDSWNAMRVALENFKAKPDESIYRVFFDREFKFQYPPSSLMFSYCVSQITPGYVMVEKVITWLSVLIMMFFVIKIYTHFFKFSWLAAGSLVILMLLYYPMMKAQHLGQIQAWINAMFAALFYFHIKGKLRIAGVLLGLICLIKPQCVVIAVWALIRNKKDMFFAFLAVTVAGTLAAVAIFGMQNHFDYLKVLSILSKHGEVYYPNQSLNGLLNRVFLDHQILDFSHRFLPPHNPIVYYASLIFAGVLFLSALVVPHRSRGTLDLCIIAITTTVISPIAWEHHYGILFPIYVFVFWGLLKTGASRWTWIFFGLSYFMCSHFFKMLNYLAYVPIANLLLSYLFFGALILLAICYKSIGRIRDERAGEVV